MSWCQWSVGGKRPWYQYLKGEKNVTVVVVSRWKNTMASGVSKRKNCFDSNGHGAAVADEEKRGYVGGWEALWGA